MQLPAAALAPGFSNLKTVLQTLPPRRRRELRARLRVLARPQDARRHRPRSFSAEQPSSCSAAAPRLHSPKHGACSSGRPVRQQARVSPRRLEEFLTWSSQLLRQGQGRPPHGQLRCEARRPRTSSSIAGEDKIHRRRISTPPSEALQLPHRPLVGTKRLPKRLTTLSRRTRRRRTERAFYPPLL